MTQVNLLYLTALLTILFITSLTISAELSKETKDWLKATFTHHWIGKGVLASVFFVALTGILYLAKFNQVNNVDIRTWSIAIVLITFISIVSITAYFYLHFIGAA